MWREVKRFLGRQGRVWGEHASELLDSWWKSPKEGGDACDWRITSAKSIPPESHEEFEKAFDLLIRIERMERIIDLEKELRRRAQTLKDFWRDGVPVCPVGQDDGCASCLCFRQQDAMCVERNSGAHARNEARRTELLFRMRQGLCPEYVRAKNAQQMKKALELPELPWIAVTNQRQKRDIMKAAEEILQSQANLFLVELHIITLLSTSAIRLRERHFGRDTCVYVVMRELKYGPRDWTSGDGDAPHDRSADE